MNVLEINNVTKRFGNLVAVRDVSLSVAKGELCAIIGPNGAGKTTFFNLISGFFPPTAGAIISTGFMPLLEAGGGGTNNSAGNAPVFQVQRIDNG